MARTKTTTKTAAKSTAKPAAKKRARKNSKLSGELEGFTKDEVLSILRNMLLYRRFEESIEQYRLAIEQSPDDAQTHFLLARALLGLGDLSGALAALDRCLALEPGHQEAIILRASVESQQAE